MMFNTDFEMFYDLQLNNATSETECNLNPLCGQDGSCSDDECPVAPVYAQSASYAQVNFFTSILVAPIGTVQTKPIVTI